MPLFIALLAGCGEAPAPPGVLTLGAWAHAGRAEERAVLAAQAARFQARNPDLAIRLTWLPEGGYNAQVQAAAVAGDLPDLLEFDGPYLYNYVWQGQLTPLDGLLPAALAADLLPSLLDQGRYRGRLYGVGVYDSGLGLYARGSALARIGARLPAGPADAWSAAEFGAILAALAALDADGAVLDAKLNDHGEWLAYAFSPILQSAGADLIDRRDAPRAGRRAGGVLDGTAAQAALGRWQAWHQAGYLDANLDDAAFVTGRVALSWAGHWEWPRYHAAFGADLVLLPLPDFGHGSRTGQGSWVWGIHARGARAQAATRFIAFLLEPGEVLAMAQANGAVPGRRSALARSPLYGPGGPLRLFAEQLTGGHAVPRPKTPAYPVISAAFRQAMEDIRDGGAVRAALKRAAAEIDRDIADNGGYR